VVKGEHGLGLDLAKTPSGLVQVTKLKEMPSGVQNPARACNPPIAAGDIIVEVNGKAVVSFAEAVKAMRNSVGIVELTLERRG
jgi:C-terminal processing protease CtpA/Prc